MATPAARLDRYRRIANRARRIPGEHGLRENAVSLVIAATTGTHTGDGTRTETVTAITESGGYPPKVRLLNDEERALGQLDTGTIEVGPITPAFSAGGTALATLTGSTMTTGEVRLLRITGPLHPNGADYRIIDVQGDRAIHLMVRAQPVGSQE